jgi:hypothetical protein
VTRAGDPAFDEDLVKAFAATGLLPGEKASLLPFGKDEIDVHVLEVETKGRASHLNPAASAQGAFSRLLF